MISCKIPVDEMRTVKNYRDSLAEAMFHCALNQRFFKISRCKDPPYFSCSSAADVLVRPVKAYIMTSSCREGGTVEALESMLTEVNVTFIPIETICNCFYPYSLFILFFRLPDCGFMGFQIVRYLSCVL